MANMTSRRSLLIAGLLVGSVPLLAAQTVVSAEDTRPELESVLPQSRLAGAAKAKDKRKGKLCRATR